MDIPFSCPVLETRRLNQTMSDERINIHLRTMNRARDSKKRLPRHENGKNLRPVLNENSYRQLQADNSAFALVVRQVPEPLCQIKPT